MKTRKELIDSGKVWQVYPNDNPDNVIFEGTKTRCMDYIKLNCQREYKQGKIRLGRLILELE